MSAITEKLNRYSFKLSEMQDIGGCRAVVSTVHEVYRLARIYEERQSHWNHTLDDQRDYIKEPKARSGYRGIHLIYRHASRMHPDFNGHKIEIQLRSQLQHTWATAVETADVFLRQGLKVSRGPEDWTRFFILMGSAIAYIEGCKPVPRTPADRKELIAEIERFAEQLEIMTKFRSWGQALKIVENSPNALKKAHYLVLVLDPRNNSIAAWGYKAAQSEAATEQYLLLEKNKPEGGDVVLVSVEHAADLQRAYPNYFLDTNAFVELVARVMRDRA